MTLPRKLGPFKFTNYSQDGSLRRSKPDQDGFPVPALDRMVDGSLDLKHIEEVNLSDAIEITMFEMDIDDLVTTNYYTEAGATMSFPIDVETFSRSIDEDAVRNRADDAPWVFYDCLRGSPYHGQPIDGGNDIFINRDYTNNRLQVLVKTTANTLEDAKPLRSVIIKKVIKTIFNYYKKAHCFWTPAIYDPDSILVTRIRELAETTAARVEDAQYPDTSNPGEGLEFKTFNDDGSENVYNLSSWGLTTEEIRSPEKIVEVAQNKGILRKYYIADYLEPSGYNSMIVDEDFIVTAESPVYYRFDIDASYIEGIPTIKMVKSSWIEDYDDENNQEINLGSPGYDSAKQEWATKQDYNKFLETASGRMLVCSYALKFEDLPPEQKAQCERELAEMGNELDAFGFSHMGEDADWEELAKRYPAVARQYTHLKNRYGTMYNALKDDDARDRVLKEVGKKMYQAEMKALRKGIYDQAMRRNTTNMYNAAYGLQKENNHKYRTRGNNQETIINMGKFEGMLSTVIRAFNQFDGQLSDFYAMGGKLTPQRMKFIPSLGAGAPKADYLKLRPGIGTGGFSADRDKFPKSSNVKKNILLRSANDNTQNTSGFRGGTGGMKTQYKGALSFSQEATNLRAAADLIKKFVQKNMKHLFNMLEKNGELLPIPTQSEPNYKARKEARGAIRSLLEKHNTYFLPSVMGMQSGKTVGSEVDSDPVNDDWNPNSSARNFFSMQSTVNAELGLLFVTTGSVFQPNAFFLNPLIPGSNQGLPPTFAAEQALPNPFKITAKNLDELATYPDALQKVVANFGGALSTKPMSPVFLKLDKPISFTGFAPHYEYLNLGLPHQSAPGQSIGSLMSNLAKYNHVGGFLKFIKEIDSAITQFSTCSQTAVNAAGVAGLMQAAHTPAGLALGVATTYVYPQLDPTGFQKATAGSDAYLKNHAIRPGQSSLVPAYKAVQEDLKNSAEALNSDYDAAMKRQIDAIRSLIPPHDKRCFDWKYIQDVFFRSWNMRNVFCKMVECLGITLPFPLPSFDWPGWPDWPKFPWPPTNHFVDLWEVIKELLLALLCRLIMMLLDIVRLDCDLLSMMMEELIEKAELADELNAMEQWIRKTPMMQELVEVFTGPFDPLDDVGMRSRIREELEMDCYEPETEDDETMVEAAAAYRLTVEQDKAEPAAYNPRKDIASVVSELRILATPAEFCEILSGETSESTGAMVGALVATKYPRLFQRMDHDPSNVVGIISNVAELTVGKSFCAALSKAPDMVTPPSSICIQPSLRENLLSRKLSKEELQHQLDLEKEKRDDFFANILGSGKIDNVLLGGLGVGAPAELVGGTPDTVSDPNNPVIMPHFDNHEIEFRKQIIETRFIPIKRAYNTDIEQFTTFLEDVENPKPMKEPKNAYEYRRMYPEGEVSEKQESMLFKQMMENPYSGLYKTYEQVINELGETAAEAIRHLHFFRPQDPKNLTELSDDLKKTRMESMFLSWQKNLAGSSQPGATPAKKEIAKRLKKVLTNSSLIQTIKDGENFYVELAFPNVVKTRSPEDLNSQLVNLDLGGKMIYDSTPGLFCATDFTAVEDSYKITFSGEFFARSNSGSNIDSFEKNPSKIPLDPGGPIYKYFIEEMDIRNNEPFQPTAFAEMLRLNTEGWSWLNSQFQTKAQKDSFLKTRDGFFFETAMAAYNEMEQYIFESFGRFVSSSLVLNPLKESDVFPRGSRELLAATDVGRAGIEILAERLNPQFTESDPPCPIPGLMDWDSVKDKIISQLGYLLTERYGDEPSWPTPLQYSVASAGFLNSWVRLEMVQIMLEGLVSFYEFGLGIMDEEMLVLYIRNRIAARNRKEGRGFKVLFESLLTDIVTNKDSGKAQITPKEKVGIDKFKIRFEEVVEDPEFDYSQIDPIIKANIVFIKERMQELLSASESIYDGFYSTFPSLDLFKNIKIMYDKNSDFPTPEGEQVNLFDDPEGTGWISYKQDRVLFSRTGRTEGSYQPSQENQIFKPIYSNLNSLEVKEDIEKFIGEGTFAFQKYIKFVPNEQQGQTHESLASALLREGSATDPDFAAAGGSFLEENPYFYPNAIPLSDFQSFVEGLGGPPPEEEGDMEWWVEHFASRVALTPEDLYRDDDEVPYPENTYYNIFSADTSKKRLAESILAKMTVPPSRSQLSNSRRIPGLARHAPSPQGGAISVSKGAEGVWYAEGVNPVMKDAEGYWAIFSSTAVVDTPYFEIDQDHEGNYTFDSKFMNPYKWNSPSGRNELNASFGQSRVYGNYIQDELTAKSAAGSFLPGSSPASVIDQTSSSGRMFLDFWQLPESMRGIESYQKDYENLWIPARFEVIRYRYKENPRFIHGSTDLFKDKEGVMQTLQEIKSAIESVKFLDGPWDALHKEYRTKSSPHYGYGYRYTRNYTKDTMLDEYMTEHITKIDGSGNKLPNRWSGTPIDGGIAESQTWKDCIDRALTMIANWPTMNGSSDDVFEELNISDTSAGGVQAYNSHLNPYRVSGHTGKLDIRWDGRRVEESRVAARKVYSIWWWDLACMIANEFDNEESFEEFDSTSKLSEMLSFQDEYEQWATSDPGLSRTGQRYDGDWSHWANCKSNFRNALKGNNTQENGGYRRKFYYGNVFPSGHRQGHATWHAKAWDDPIAGQIGPDIIPPWVQKRKDGGKSRPTDFACYVNMRNASGQFGRAKVEAMIEEARLLLEARDKYNFSVDPSTLNARGRRYYGYYERFLIQRLRLPDWNSEFVKYNWVHQRNLRVSNQENFRNVYGQYNTSRYPETFRRGLRMNEGEGLLNYNFGFSYKKYGLPETPTDWKSFMSQVSDMITYVKQSPVDAEGNLDASKPISSTTGSVSDQYAVHFVNAKAVFSGVLRSPTGEINDSGRGVTPRETVLPGLDIIEDGAYDEKGGFRVVEALMDPNHSAWGEMSMSERARLIRDNVKIVSRPGSGGLSWWRKLRSMWGFKGKVWWNTTYTTEVVGETKSETINLDPSETHINIDEPTPRRIGESSMNAHLASLHPVGGENEGKGFYLWSRGYKLSALANWRTLETSGKAWFYNPGVQVDSPNAFFFTWADDDIHLNRDSTRAVSKFVTKNKLAERIIGVSFDSEAMWFGDQSSPEDMDSTDGTFNSFTTSPDRPADYWAHTRLTPLLENADFGRISGLSTTNDRQNSDFNNFSSKIRNILTVYNNDDRLNALVAGRGGTSLTAIFNTVSDQVEGTPSILLDQNFSVRDNSRKLKIDQLSVLDFWPENCASDTNPYSWHRDYVFYNAFKKTREVKESQNNFSSFEGFYSISPGEHDLGWWIKNHGRGMNTSDVLLGVVKDPRSEGDYYDDDVLIIETYEGVSKAPAKMIGHFLPYSEKEDIYIPSPFGVHPNLGLYSHDLQTDPGHQNKTARPNTPAAKRQAPYGLRNMYPLGPEVSVYTATKTLVRKRVSFCIDRPEHYGQTGSLGTWFYGVEADAEGNIIGLDLPPDKIDEITPALRYFESRNLEGNPISVHLAASDADDLESNSVSTMIGIAKEIESENFLGLTYLRMWQARKYYLKEYARWAQEDVVEAFERLTTSIANCNLQYASRLIYIPKMESSGPSFAGWDKALGANGLFAPDNITVASKYRRLLNEESTNMGLEVVTRSDDEVATLSPTTTANSKVVPIPYVPIVEKFAPIAISDLVKIEKASADEIEALGFSRAFADLVSEQDGGLPLVKFLTSGDEFTQGAFTSSLLPTNENDQSPALNVQDYLIEEIKNSKESEVLFKYLFPLKRYASIYSVYSISATSSLYNMNNLFFDTREKLRVLLKTSMDIPYDVFPTEFEKLGIMSPEMAQHYITTRISGFRTDQWSQIYKMIINAPKSMAMMILSITDPFYFDAQEKLRQCDLRRGMNPTSFAIPFKDNNKGHQLKPFTLYPPIPFIPPWMIGPMDIGLGGLYDSDLDSMASPLGPALLSAGSLLGDTPKAICNYREGDSPPSATAFGPLSSLKLRNQDCDD